MRELIESLQFAERETERINRRWNQVPELLPASFLYIGDIQPFPQSSSRFPVAGHILYQEDDLRGLLVFRQIIFQPSKKDPIGVEWSVEDNTRRPDLLRQFDRSLGPGYFVFLPAGRIEKVKGGVDHRDRLIVPLDQLLEIAGMNGIGPLVDDHLYSVETAAGRDFEDPVHPVIADGSAGKYYLIRDLRVLYF